LYDEFIKYETYRLYPDVLPALEALRERGVALGIISNWEGWLESLLLHLQIRDFFATTTISGHHGVEKPDPRIFELALRGLGVAPAEAAHVGDSVPHDVEGARRAGLLPVLIDRHGAHGRREYLRIADLRELPAALGLDGRAGT
jgi:putative hydrolase of the HAD superfamily